MRSNTVSVIIPLYNKANHIKRTLDSVIAQTRPVDEIIVIDDGSTDNGAQVVKDLNIPNLSLIHQSNQGVSAARNRGIEESKSQYITFIDADDQWNPQFIEQMLLLSLSFPQAGAYASRYQYVLGENQFREPKIALKKFPKKFGLLKNFYDIAGNGDLPFLVSSMLIKADVFETIGNFPMGEKMGEDQDVICKIVESYDVVYSKNINLLYHTDADNRACINNLPTEECGFSKRVMQRLQSNPELEKAEKTARIRFCAAHVCHLAKRNVLAGNIKEARALLNDNRLWLKPLHKVFLTFCCFFPFSNRSLSL